MVVNGLKISFLVLVLVISFSMASCGDDAQNPTTPPPPKTNPPASGTTAKEKLEALENSGAIPKLDRTDSIAGIDANANGIRDDVETYIATHYPNPTQRAAAVQFAVVMQDSMLVDKVNMSAVKAISIRSLRAVNCIYSKFDNSSTGKQAGAVVAEIRSISANTKARLLAYLAYAKALDGSVSRLPEENTCE